VRYKEFFGGDQKQPKMEIFDLHLRGCGARWGGVVNGKNKNKFECTCSYGFLYMWT
jgi:hypothetical protein